MGFSVTASHLIFLVAAIAVGGALTGTAFHVAGGVSEGYFQAWRNQDEALHTSIVIVDDGEYPDYDAGTETLIVRIVNAGATVLDVNGFTYLIDGAYANGQVTATTVNGDAQSGILVPGDTLEVTFEDVTDPPARFKVAAGNGASAYWQE